MKYAAITTIFVRSLAVAAAFTAGKTAFVRSSVATNMSSSPADFVNAEIAAHDVVVFSKSYCPFCEMTKDLLEDLKVEATVYELDQMDDGADIQNALLDLSDQSTVPNVFIKGEHIGGNDAVQDAAEAGTLQTKIGI